MQLRLAEYKIHECLSCKKEGVYCCADYEASYKDRKFEFVRFLELGESFFYGGSFIYWYGLDVNIEYEFEKMLRATKCEIKDKEDPLNRFNGLFDGRTYGEGRFVLIDKIKGGWRDESYEYGKRIILLGKHEEYADYYEESDAIGNLHQNPELWEKVK